MKYKNIDIHAQYIPKKVSIKDYLFFINQFNFFKIILTPACVKGEEPDKPHFLYWIQRRLLNNGISRYLVKILSKTFYNSSNELTFFWKLFLKKNKNFKKIMHPDNEDLLKVISDFDSLKMWLWINPLIEKHSDIKYLNNLCKNNKIIGLKFHLYWHKFDSDLIYNYEKLAIKYQLPIYIFLDFNQRNIFKNLIKLSKSVKIIIGYCGFPYFDESWIKFKEFKNIYFDISSAHIDKYIVKKCIKYLGIDRLLFGSDCPMFFKNEKGNFDYVKALNRFDKISQFNMEKVMDFKKLKKLIPRIDY